MKKEQITIIGSGWLGAPLAQSLKDKSFKVRSTTTTPHRGGVLFNVKTDIIPTELKDSDIFIYTVPPLPLNELSHFLSQLPSDLKIIFISSTSVYGKKQGEVDEESVPLPESQNGKILKETEIFIRDHFKNATILRPGGLYGKNRHPIFSLQGKSGLQNGEEFTHLVHQEDIISAIESICEKQIWGETFNLVSDLLMKKNIYYPKMALLYQLPLPRYETIAIDQPTLISNLKSKKFLAITYRSAEEKIS